MREMKESGILGIGKVPISWEQTRLGYECYIRARLGWRGLKADEYVDEGYAFISAFNIQDGKLVWEPLNYITQERYDESPEIKLNIGDVLLVKDGAGVGKSARVDSLPCGGTAPNSSIGVITPYNSMSYRYVCYYIQSPVFSNFVGLLYNGMGVPHLTQEILKTIRILMPPLDEQQSICDYLDEKCAEFDTIKSDIQSQIEALEEYKRSVITEAVTKGLDPDVEMRDSGVQWIGMIPKHWEVRKMKHIGSVRNGLTYTPQDLCDDGTLVLRSSNVQNGKLSLEDNVYVSCKVKTELMVKKGDILICSRNGSRELIGKNAIITDDIDAAFGAFMMIFRCDSPKYLYYILNSNIFSYYLGTFFTSTINQLTGANFNNMKIVFCDDKKEQKQITSYLDSKCAEIDSIIAEKKQQIDTIEEYKKSLIFEYVTGKKEVP